MAVLPGPGLHGPRDGTRASYGLIAGAFKDVARFIFAFAIDPDDGAQVITQTKNSLGNLPSLAYRIVSATVRTGKGDANVGRFILDGVTDRTVQDILGQQGNGADRDEKSRAENYLKTALSDGPRLSKDIEEEAREAYGISLRTLKRARSDLRIPAKKDSDGSWWISLPEHEGDLNDRVAAKSAKSAKSAKGASPGPVGTLCTLPRSADNAMTIAQQAASADPDGQP